MSLEAPYGALTAALRTQPKVLPLLGAGIGITPLPALLEELTGDVVLVRRASRSEDLALRAEVDLLALVPDVAERDVHLCGPDGFTAVAGRALRAAGVPSRQAHAESFALEAAYRTSLQSALDQR